MLNQPTAQAAQQAMHSSLDFESMRRYSATEVAATSCKIQTKSSFFVQRDKQLQLLELELRVICVECLQHHQQVRSGTSLVTWNPQYNQVVLSLQSSSVISVM